MKRILCKFITSLAAGAFAAGKAQACGLALILAVDVSGSVSPSEYRIQIDGLAAALRDGIVADALLAENARVMLIQWSGSQRQVVSVPWHRLNEMSDIASFAAKVGQVQRVWKNYSTAIGEVLIFSATQFDAVPMCDRKVIDVSGDGYSNEGVLPIDIRASLVRSDIVINGLAIEGSADAITDYYRDFVIAGTGAFVVTANSFDEYPKRIRQKLLREVGNVFALAED